jgi:hypothetical protein
MMVKENNNYQTPCIVPTAWDLTPPVLQRVNTYITARDTISIIRATHDNVNTTWAVDFPDDANNFFDPRNVPFLAAQQLGCSLIHQPLIVEENFDVQLGIGNGADVIWMEEVDVAPAPNQAKEDIEDADSDNEDDDVVSIKVEQQE